MLKDDSVYVGHMLDMARKAAAKVAGKSRAEYDSDENLRIVLAHLIQTIGEAASRVSPETQARHARIPWKGIIGIRHRIVHDYIDVDYDILWEVVTKDIPVLIAALEKLAPPD